MQVRFFGVRGSVPTPGSATVRYGGNTVCVEVRLADGTIVIFDAGTGIRELGKVLMAEGLTSPLSLLFTHVHWDHIIGLPFFGPIWRRDTTVRIYPLANDAHRDSTRRRALFDGVHFPVRGSDIPARMDLLETTDLEWRVGSARVRRIGLNHPGGAQGFRCDDEDGSSLAYLTDNELPLPGTRSPDLDNLAAFANGVNLLIHDAQYDEFEISTKRGWGHSSMASTLELGRLAGTAHLILFHHDPDRDDDALDAFGARAATLLSERGSSTKVTVAYEGLIIDLVKGVEVPRGTPSTVPGSVHSSPNKLSSRAPRSP